MEKLYTVLIVGVMDRVSSILERLLEGKYQLLLADNMKRAFELLDSSEEINLILFDKGMPKEEALANVVILKSTEAYNRIPVMIHLDEADWEFENRAFACGVDDFSIHPLDSQILQKRVENLILKNLYMQERQEIAGEEKQDYQEIWMKQAPYGIAVYSVEEDVQIININESLCTMTGYTMQEFMELFSKNPLDIIVEKERKIFSERLFLQEEKRSRRFHLLHKNGRTVFISVVVRQMSSEGNVKQFYAIFTDLSLEKRSNRSLDKTLMELRYRAERDTLTGLYNRETFYKKVAGIVMEEPRKKYVIVFLNIDRFKVVNELFSKKTGDVLLVNMANLIMKKVSHSGVCSRFEADHFVLCLQKEFLENEFSFFEALFSGAGEWNPVNYPIQLHAGIYEIEDVSMPVDLMCDRAAMALEMVMGSYLQHYMYYNEEMKLSIMSEQNLINEMETALIEKQFKVFYQPIVDAQTKKIVSAEALVRWIHPERGLISPGYFIPAFEKNGFISKLDMYVCREVCAFLSEQIQLGRKVVPISINISRINFYNANLHEEIHNITKEYGISSELLKIEITESAYEDNPLDLVKAIKVFQHCGFKVLMDDFGSGYSSLNMLKDITIDILKIDMKFVSNMENSDRATNILLSIIRMAKSIDMQTVAEGVENKDQYEILAGMGCDCIQGYYFYKPMPQDEFVTVLQECSQKDTMVSEKKQSMVLIIDDEKFNRVIARDCIGGQYGILEAEDGEMALEVLKKNFQYIRLIILDVCMPKMNGLEFLERIHNLSYLQNIPIMVVTGYDFAGMEEQILDLGAIDIIRKPVDSGLLKKRIENIIRISELRTIANEISYLRESSIVKKQMDGILANGAVGVARFRVPYDYEKEKIFLEFVNERYLQLHHMPAAAAGIYFTLEQCFSNVAKEDKAVIIEKLDECFQKRVTFSQLHYSIEQSSGMRTEVITNYALSYEKDGIVADVVNMEVGSEQ